jgi:hypothetical protein
MSVCGKGNNYVCTSFDTTRINIYNRVARWRAVAEPTTLVVIWNSMLSEYYSKLH